MNCEKKGNVYPVLCLTIEQFSVCRRCVCVCVYGCFSSLFLKAIVELPLLLHDVADTEKVVINVFRLILLHKSYK